MKPAFRFCLFAASLLPAAGFADTTTFLPGAGDWFTPAHWSNGVPDSGSSAEIVNSGLAQIASGSAVVDVLTLGSSSGHGLLTVSGGTLTTGSSDLGYDVGSIGTATVSGGTWNVDGLTAGRAGTGNVLVSGGVLNAGTITVGAEASGNGSLLITGGVVQTSQIVKGAGTGMVTLEGGTLRATANQPDFLSGLTLDYGTEAPSSSSTSLIDTNGFDIGISGVTSHVGQASGAGLGKIGAGTLTITGDSTFVTGITVSEGKLNIPSGRIKNGHDNRMSYIVTSLDGSSLELGSDSFILGDNGLGTFNERGDEPPAAVLKMGSGETTLNGFIHGGNGGSAVMNTSSGYDPHHMPEAYQPSGGKGGTGVLFAFGDVASTLTNNGSIFGGTGGAAIGFGNTFPSGKGGPAIHFGSGTVINNGQIFGGDGYTGTKPSEGAPGVLITFNGTLATLVTGPSSTITGGLNGSNPRTSELEVLAPGVRTEDGAATIIHHGTIIGPVEMADFANSVTLFVGSSITDRLVIGTSSAATLTLDGAGTQSYAAAVGQETYFEGTLIKQGVGTWNLDHEILTFRPGPTPGTWIDIPSTLAGTLVNEGTLLVNTTLDSTVTVADGATLGGAGTVGSVTIQDGGTLAPGNSPGLMELTGSLTMEAGSTLEMQLTGTTSGLYDQLAISGTFTAGGTLFLDVGYAAAYGDTFTLFTDGSTGCGWDAGSFVIDTNLSGGLIWDTSNLASDGVLSVVPEPATWGLLLGTGAMMFARRRRRASR